MAAGDRLPDGTYQIRLASNPSLALDVAGAGDARGTNIRLWSANDSDAQFFTAFSQGAEQMVYVPAAGRAVDIADQRMADGTNVRLWDSWEFSQPGAALAQTWDILETGETAAVGGKSYPVYKVLAHKDGAFCMEVSGDSTPKAGDNVWLWHWSTADAPGRRWVFLPVASVPDGTYSVRTALDPTYCLSVAGASSADQTPCQIWKWVEDAPRNELVFRVETKKGVTTFESPIRSGLCLNLRGGKAASGTLTQFYGGPASAQGPSGTPSGPGKLDFANQWAMQPQGAAVDVGGVSCPSFRIVPQADAGSRVCLDVAGGSTQLATAVRVWSRNGTPAQAFVLVPAEEHDASLGAPSKVCGSVGGERRSLFALAPSSAPVTVFPAWESAGTSFEVRYRTRSRRGTGSLSSWGEWMSASNGSTGNSGWGVAWTPDFAGMGGGSAKTGALGVAGTIGPSGCSRLDVQFEVRRFEMAGAYATHGPSSTGTATLAWLPTVRVTALGFGADGLTVGYTSDLALPGATVAVDVPGLGSGSFTGVAASGSVSIPWSDLRRVPDDGESATVDMTYWTADGAAATVSATLPVSWSGGSGASLSPSVAVYGAPRASADPVTVARAASMTVADLAGYRVADLLGEDAPPAWCAVAAGYPSGTKFYLLVERGHGSKLVEVDPSFVPYPLGVAWHLFATYSKGSAWAVWHREFPAVRGTGYLVDAPDGSAGIEVSAGGKGKEGPDFQPTYELDASTYTTTGRERPVVVRGRTVKATWSLDGYLLAPDLDVKRAAADWAAHAGLIVFRGPYGFWAKAYVTSAKVDLGRRSSCEVSLSFTEVG